MLLTVVNFIGSNFVCVLKMFYLYSIVKLARELLRVLFNVETSAKC